MTYFSMGATALDYLPCRYGSSKLLFRGPRRDLKDEYIAFLGGTRTYGKFIADPFPALVESELGKTCVNFGYPNAGIDAYLQDPFVLEAASIASATVIQLVGAANLSNRFYTVHPRRNDRFTEASDLLKTIYRDVDFSDFHFNRHMLGALAKLSSQRFATVRTALQDAWVAKMRTMLSRIEGPKILLWFGTNAPPENEIGVDLSASGLDPLFVTRRMIDQIGDRTTEFVMITPSRHALAEGTKGMVFDEMQHAAAKELLGPVAHQEVAKAVQFALKKTS